MRNIPELHVQPLLDWDAERGRTPAPRLSDRAVCLAWLALSVAGWLLFGLGLYYGGQGIGALTLAVGW